MLKSHSSQISTCCISAVAFCDAECFLFCLGVFGLFFFLRFFSGSVRWLLHVFLTAAFHPIEACWRVEQLPPLKHLLILRRHWISIFFSPICRFFLAFYFTPFSRFCFCSSQIAFFFAFLFLLFSANYLRLAHLYQRVSN